ncbi:DUF4412 domain-containing protein [Psychroflexus aestuariivivens]|uniref:DUF4412 domain-containing protein n=1 Tax=Psychroflexus aestuariivivens TaxID=1795040 RepID=UPI000FD9331C|nr:DUF4412 domain-containing protein [Psychroflexus aestuariivivens]
MKKYTFLSVLLAICFSIQNIEAKNEKYKDNLIDYSVNSITLKSESLIFKNDTTKNNLVVTSQRNYLKLKNNSKTKAVSEYKFTHETVYEITVSNQDRTYKMSYLLNPDAQYVGMKTNMSGSRNSQNLGESIIVIDDNESTVFMNKSGNKMQMSLSQMGGQQQTNPTDQMRDYNYNNLKKTGKTKTILGETCYEYAMTDQKKSVRLWIAPNIDIPNWFIDNKGLINGHVMGYTIDSEEAKITSEIVEIKDNINKTIDPAEYKKMM